MEEFSLMEKLFGKPFISSRDVLGKVVQFRVLSNEDRVDVWRRNPTNDLLTLSETISVPVLVRAIVTIDGQALTASSEYVQMSNDNPKVGKSEILERIFSKFPHTVISAMYEAYADVVEEHKRQLDELKKNSTPPNPETSG